MQASSRVTVSIEKALRDQVKISSHPCCVPDAGDLSFGAVIGPPHRCSHDEKETTVNVAQTSDLLMTGSHMLRGSSLKNALYKSEWVQMRVTSLPLSFGVAEDRRRSYLCVIGDRLIGPSRIIGIFWLPHHSFPTDYT
jgi:hypothetical protein